MLSPSSPPSLLDASSSIPPTTPREHELSLRIAWWTGLATHFPTLDGLYSVGIAEHKAKHGDCMRCADAPLGARGNSLNLTRSVARLLADSPVHVLDTWAWSLLQPSPVHASRLHVGAFTHEGYTKVDCVHYCLWSGHLDAVLDEALAAVSLPRWPGWRIR